MPVGAAVTFRSNCIITATSHAQDEEHVKLLLLRADYRGEVVSLCNPFKGFSLKTAAIRKIVWRLWELGVEGAAADLGCGYGDISWQLNALMPERKLFLFDTFTGYDARDIAKEKELALSDVEVGQYAYPTAQAQRAEEPLLSRMPYPEMVTVRRGWFPETAFELEDEKYALAHTDARLYAPTYAGL